MFFSSFCKIKMYGFQHDALNDFDIFLISKAVQ